MAYTTPRSGRAVERDEGPCQPKMLPPTLTAFTSRLSSSSSSSSPKKGQTAGKTMSTVSTTSTMSTTSIMTTPRTSAHATYISSSAISFDSDDEDDDWEDDCGPLRLLDARDPKHYDEHGNMVFRRLAVPKAAPQTSLLSQMLRQQLASGMSFANVSSSSSTTNTNNTNTNTDTTTTTTNTSTSTIMTDAQFPIDFPNPLRCHPTASSPAVSDVPQLSTSASSSSPSLSSSPSSSSSSSSSPSSPSSPPPPSSPPLVHIPQVAGGLLFVHRSPRALVDSTGPFTSMPFNGACGPRADPTVVVGAPPHRDICCNGRLLRGELSSTLHTSILDENNSRYIFRQYGSRRRVGGGAGADPDSDHRPFPPVRRTQSAPDVTAVARDACRLVAEAKAQTAADMSPSAASSATCAAMAIPSAADTVLCRGVRDYRSFQFRKIEYVDDYVAPRSWSWGMDYHSKGW